MKRNILNSPRLSELKKHRRRAFLGKTLIFLFGFLVVFGFLIYISRLPRLNIDNIIVVGNKVVETEAIKEVAEKELAGDYFFVFPKTNIFLYPKNKLEYDLLNEFKRIKDVSFLVEDRKMLRMVVSERTPKYLWCDGIVMSPSVPENCYFMDEGGFIFDEAPYFSGEVYFKFYGTASLLEKSFENLISFKKTLEGMGLRPAVLSIQENRDVRIFLSTSTGPEIIFKVDSDFQKVTENLEAALTTEPLQSDFKNKYSSLLYIDLRFGNKVYFKFNESR